MSLWSRECPVCADIGWCNDHPIKDHDDMSAKSNEPESLEPCPFCGSEDVELRDFLTEALVACNICGARTGVAFMGAEEAANAAWKRQVIAAWNRRAAAHPVADAGGVTDADREAAAKCVEHGLSRPNPLNVRQGVVDSWHLVQAFVRHRLQSVAAATAKLQNRIDELTNEAEIFAADHVDQNRMVDRIADLIGLPQDQELDTVAFELWISAQTTATAAKDAEISRLKGQFDRYFHEAADAQEEVARLREGIERALCCTPSIQSERSQFHGIGDTHKIVYDCGNPWEILRSALSEAREAGAKD